MKTRRRDDSHQLVMLETIACRTEVPSEEYSSVSNQIAFHVRDEKLEDRRKSVRRQRPLGLTEVVQRSMVNGGRRASNGEFEEGNRHVAVHWDAAETVEEIKIAYGKF